jgi:uracil phosphoribosyltransferase
MAKVILQAQDLDGYLTEEDKANITAMDSMYSRAAGLFERLDRGERSAREPLIALYREMGDRMQEIISREKRVRVYSWETPSVTHGEVSRLIAKLRDERTQREEFVYYIQRAYELLFNMAYCGPNTASRNYLVVKTPVNFPIQNYAVHKIPHIDEDISDTVMCVMLRGSLLPSMIMSKEIQEYSSDRYVTPFALFKVSRNDRRREDNMEYILDLDRSYIDLASLDGRQLIFADPMNATGGSLVTIIKYLRDQGVRPKSIRFFNAISALKGALRIARAIEEAEVLTLWMDPVLNAKAYILPGLGDAGDRLNGADEDEHPRNIIQLIAAYGTNIVSLYRSQVRKIEETVLGRLD